MTPTGLNPDFQEFLRLLASSGVRFLIVGAWARAAYGEPRLTGDMEVWISADPRESRLMVKVIEDFGFGSLGLAEEDFQNPDQVIQLGFSPRRIDILTFLTGLDFEAAWSSRVKSELGGVPVHYLSKEDFIANKLAVGRPKDLADIDALVRD